jgi:hypothetical protein
MFIIFLSPEVLVGSSRGARRVAPHTNSPWAVGCVNAFQKKSLYASNYSNKRTCSKKSLAALARVHSSCRPSCWYHRRCVAFPAMSVGLFPPVATLATYWVHFVPHAIGDLANRCFRADLCMTNFDKTDKVSQFYGVLLGSI